MSVYQHLAALERIEKQLLKSSPRKNVFKRIFVKPIKAQILGTTVKKEHTGGELKKWAFGTSVERFATIGLHSEHKETKSTEVDPTTYYPKKYQCRRKALESPWTRQKEIEEYAKHLGYRENLREHLIRKDFIKANIGPTTYAVPSSHGWNETPQERGFGYGTRLPPIKNKNPGPGCHGADIFKRSSIARKSGGKTPTFEWDGFFDRFRLPRANRESLPPNTYRTKEPDSLDARLNRVVSKRGPYDLFTGPRDGSTIKNHFAENPTEGADIFYDIKSKLDLLSQDARNKGPGLFSKQVGRVPEQKVLCGKQHQHTPVCYQNLYKISPGPTTYNVDWHTIKPAEKSKYPFGTHITLKKGHRKEKIIFPGPGRYYIKDIRCIRAYKNERARSPPLRYLYERDTDKVARELHEKKFKEKKPSLERTAKTLTSRARKTSAAKRKNVISDGRQNIISDRRNNVISEGGFWKVDKRSITSEKRKGVL